MLNFYEIAGHTLVKTDALGTITDATIWIDIVDPTPEEDRLVEVALGIDIPTRAEAREIETSNRLYVEKGAYFMTAFVMYDIEKINPGSSNVTFILAGNRLVTVRYVEPKAFPFYLARVERGDATCNSAPAILIGLLETMLHRQADLIERIQDDVDKMAQGLFELDGKQKRKNRGQRHEVYLKGTGRDADIIARTQECAISIERVLAYFNNAARDRGDHASIPERIESARRDNHSLIENMKFLQGRTSFLLEATLGMINTEQNQIIKLFSVMAVMLMPPTLIASVYGMNFKQMPELSFEYGYPMALGLMLLSGIIPFIYFKRKGWL
jgi:magnesium transporter